MVVVVLGQGRVVLERNEEKSRTNLKQPSELKVCDPMICQVGGQNGRLLMHLGKGNVNQVQGWRMQQCVDGNGRLGTTGFS